MRKAVLVLIVCTLFLVPLSACKTGAHEIDEWGYVFSIGVDRGVSDKLRITFQFPSFSAGQSGGSGASGASAGTTGAKDLTVITIDCPTLYAGVVMINSSYSRDLNFSHAKYIIISEDIAKESVLPFINGMSRSPQVRPSMYVVVCKGKAADFINEFQPKAGASVSKSMELLMQSSDASSLYKSVTFNDFNNDIKSLYTQPIATLAAINNFSSFKESGKQPNGFQSEGDYYPGEVPRKGLNKFEFMGTALFNGAQMIGELNGNETRSMLMLRGSFMNSSITIPDPLDSSLRITAYVYQRKKPKIRIKFEDDIPKIYAKVFLNATLQNVQNAENIEYKYKTITENAYEAFIKEKLDQTIKKCQKLNCEVFEFGDRAAAKFWTIQKWEAYNWLSHFKEAEVTTEVEFVIRRTGTLITTQEEKRV